MYILNEDEEKMLTIIIKFARIDYFKNNNLYFEMENIDDLDLSSNENIENELMDSKIQVETLEEIFLDQNMYETVKALTNNEKLVLFLFYIDGRSDKEISKLLSITWEAVKSKRKRIIAKIRKKLNKGDGGNV